jgi:hypothetical protein
VKALLALCLCVVLALLPGASARATPSSGLDPTTLPRGADPAVTWLGGTVMHTRGGRERGLPIPAAKAGVTRFLGRSRHSWVVGILGGPYVASTKVVRIHHGRYRTVVTVPSYYDRPTYLLTRHGDRLFTVDYDRGGSEVTAYDLDGHVLGHLGGALGVQPLDAAGDALYLGAHGTERWQPGDGRATLATYGGLVDVPRDVVFVGRDKGVGPTSLSHPGEPAWSVRGFAPRSVSPDGQWVAGYTAASITGRHRRLVVRSMVDGSPQPTTGLLQEPDAALGWEDGGHLLVGVHSSRGNALLRCDVGGSCERATDWLPGQAISLPHQPEYFFDWP